MPSPLLLCQHCIPSDRAPEKLRWLGLVLVTVTLFAGVELWVGHMSHSLTLRADSGHMLNDSAAMGIALLAAAMARRSLAQRQEISQFELLAAAINGLGLLAMAAWIGREALIHWHGEPTAVLSLPMLVTACLGLVINGLNLYWLHGDIHQDLNLRGAFLHVLADFLGSIGAVVAALAMTLLHWMWADVVIGFAIALLIGLSALPLLRRCWQQFRQGGDRAVSAPPLESVGWLETGSTDLVRYLQK